MFGLGVMLEALIEAYTIFHTVLMILLVVAALMSFFAFAGFLAARSVIFKTYMDISLATCEMAERIGSVWLMFALSTQVANLDAEIGLGRNYWLEKKKKVLEEAIDSLAEDL